MFTLAPTVVSVVWRVDRFSTHWSIVVTLVAAGATLYGILFAKVYDDHHGDDGTCLGLKCYANTFWVMASSVLVAVLLWVWTWRGKGGWKAKGVIV